jgi:hypothetical protein
MPIAGCRLAEERKYPIRIDLIRLDVVTARGFTKGSQNIGEGSEFLAHGLSKGDIVRD